MIEMPDKLIEEISSRNHQKVLLIAIDGAGGAGKTTAAEELALKLGDVQILHIDDFYKPKEERIEITEQTPVHSNFEFDRLKHQVFEPLDNLTIASYQTSDGNSAVIQPSRYVVVEGLGTLGEELRNYFDYKIWIDSSEAVRRQRGIERDSVDWAGIWDNEYIPQDARYIREQAPQRVADWILYNS